MGYAEQRSLERHHPTFNPLTGTGIDEDARCYGTLIELAPTRNPTQFVAEISIMRR